ncbi:hypothetical protein VTJ04DRAFT_4885 [Mycothermus thermophilus]|uniref:uncharacterized protein n=1 Tax=Humicola insolens TaxID=85995 RepID=UPI003742BA6C
MHIHRSKHGCQQKFWIEIGRIPKTNIRFGLGFQHEIPAFAIITARARRPEFHQHPEVRLHPLNYQLLCHCAQTGLVTYSTIALYISVSLMGRLLGFNSELHSFSMSDGSRVTLSAPAVGEEAVGVLLHDVSWGKRLDEEGVCWYR